MTNQQPDALRLVDWLDDQYDPDHHKADAAAELRRLHAENAALQQGYDAARLEIESLRDEVKEYRHGAGVQKALIESLLADRPAGEYPPLPVAHIRDVDFMKTHFVVIDSQGFQVAWREEEVLPFVGRPELPGYDAWQEETALFLKYEEDGLLFEAYLTVEGLSALTWSAEKEAFVGPEGSVYTFYTEEKYRPYVPRS